MSPAEQALARASRTWREATARRDALIVQLRADGLSLRQIAPLAGMTHMGVKKILTKSVNRLDTSP